MFVSCWCLENLNLSCGLSFPARKMLTRSSWTKRSSPQPTFAQRSLIIWSTQPTTARARSLRRTNSSLSRPSSTSTSPFLRGNTLSGYSWMSQRCPKSRLRLSTSATSSSCIYTKRECQWHLWTRRDSRMTTTRWLPSWMKRPRRRLRPTICPNWERSRTWRSAWGRRKSARRSKSSRCATIDARLRAVRAMTPAP